MRVTHPNLHLMKFIAEPNLHTVIVIMHRFGWLPELISIVTSHLNSITAKLIESR